MAYLEIKNLTFQYAGSEKTVLHEVSLAIEEGSFVLICGASGSGKSTLLKMIKPQLKPVGRQNGAVYLTQQEISTYPESVSATKIGYVSQQLEEQIITENVWQELAFGLENMGLSAFEIKSRIAELANYLGIQTLLETKTSSLSGGQKQLLNLASVLVMKPDILILDEPTAQLDPIASQNFLELLIRLNKEMGLTILLAEHQLEAIFSRVDQVILLEEGQLVFADKPQVISTVMQTNSVELSRFRLSLPSALQIYLKSGIQEANSPITVIEGKRFLERHCHKQLPDEEQSVLIKKSENQVMQLKDGWFRYEKNTEDILAGVDLTLYEGEIFSLVGGNGTGKTTLLKVLAGLYKCYYGKLLLFGRPAKKQYQAIGYLPQEPQMMFIKDSVEEEYQSFLTKQNVTVEEQQNQIEKVTALLDLNGCLKQHPLDLSGGECQRAALGKLLLSESSILLLDEPTKGIDNYGKKQLIMILRNLATQGKTILVVTHDLEFAAELSDRCGLFFQNKVLAINTPEVFFSNHTFYTTAASRISRSLFHGLVTTDQVIKACQDTKGSKDG